MKILHSPQNIGGMAGVLANEHRKLGIYSKSYAFSDNLFEFKSDIQLENEMSNFEKIKVALKFAKEYDVFQFYFGNSLMGPSLIDVPLLYKMGKKIAFYFCGCDIRDEKYTIFSYETSACKYCFPKMCSKNRKKAVEIANKYSDVNFVSTPDLLEFVDRSVLLPQPIDLEEIYEINETIKENNNKRNNNEFIISHAPTNRKIKGTQFIIDTINELNREGVNVKLKLIENLPHKKALIEYSKSDMAIDQLLVGSYGLLTAELMALGIPTAVYIRDDLVEKYYGELPVIRTSVENLKDTIMYYYLNRGELKDISIRSKDYAQKFHNPQVIANICLEWYNK